MNEFEKAELKRKVIIGLGAAAVVGIVILEKRRVDRLIEMSQAAVHDTMWNSWDEGVQFGMDVAKKFYEDQKAVVGQTSMEDIYKLGRPLNQGSLS